MKKNGTIIKGSFFLAMGAFFSKVLGAIYRIPLLNIISAKGMGLYQMVFPVYCILLDFAGSGAPNAIAKLIAENSEDKNYISKKYLKSSIFLLCCLGLTFSFLMIALSLPLSNLQGDKNAYLGYIFLSPSVLLVALISAFRGYFQGKLNMLPTAISQVLEQSVKLVFGLFLTRLFMPNIYLAVGGATLAVTISEAFALLYLFFHYKVESSKTSKIEIDKSEKKLFRKNIIKTTIPLTLIGIAIPFSNFLDSLYIVNILKKNFVNATGMYGIFSGAVISIINLPVSICYGISVVAIPFLAGEKGKSNKNEKKTVLLTVILSVPLAVICFFSSSFITNILYKNMNSEEKRLCVNLIKLLSVCIILLSLLHTENSILIAKGKTYYPLFSMGIGIIIKTVVSIILLNNVNVNIYGMGIGLITCYFVAVLINFILIKFSGEKCKLKVSKSEII